MARRNRSSAPAGCGSQAGRGLSRLAKQDKAKWLERQRLAKLEAAKTRVGELDFNHDMAIVVVDDAEHLTALFTVCNLPQNKWQVEYNAKMKVAYIAKSVRKAA